ncbi:MAG: heparan-alpha-glucosaminide N-acetyltransferase [Eubacteriales bacterium]
MMMEKKSRIWELDAFRGFCILCVILVHAIYDLRSFAGFKIDIHPFFAFIMQYGGVIFILISGICANLGRSSFKRGLIVFAFGMVISAVTYTMILMGMLHESVSIWFGILHLLGASMMLYPLFRKLPNWALGLLSVVIIIAGYCFVNLTVSVTFLFPLGLRSPGFSAGDYFPLFPNFGWFLLGGLLGKTVYKAKKTLFPKVDGDNLIIRFFSACGRHSLWIYLLHQPVVYGVISLIYG